MNQSTNHISNNTGNPTYKHINFDNRNYGQTQMTCSLARGYKTNFTRIYIEKGRLPILLQQMKSI